MIGGCVCHIYFSPLIPAKAGIQKLHGIRLSLDPGFRRDERG
jgi:hypothetical protein